MTLKCELCGEEVERGALACPRCGSPLEKKSTADEPRAPVADSEQPPPGVETDVSALADQTVWPGTETEVTPEQVVLEDKPIGGYQGIEPPSVSGAGAQTAEDPFGLTIREKAPPAAAETPSESSNRLRNIVIIAWTFLLVAAVIAAAAYFGFLRNKGKPSLDAPAGVVHEFCRLAAEGDYEGAKALAVEGAPLVGVIEGVMKPYNHQGAVTLTGFDTRTSASDDSTATVEIKKFEVAVKGKDGTTTYDILIHTRPYPLPKRVNLVKQNGKWLINS
jgi:hypothetical protein